MNIVIYGNFCVSYCTEVHHAISLQALGHKIIKLQETEVTTEEVLKQSLNADLFVWIHSHGFVNKGTMKMGEVLDKLKEANKHTMAYHLDLYMGIARWQEYELSDYMNKIQYFFTVDKLMADWLNKNTSTKAFYLPAGIVHEECYKLDLPKKYDVIFVGSRGYHQEWKYRPQLIDWLRSTYNGRFHHFGGDGLGVIRGIDLNRLYGQTKVVVGDTLCPNFNYPYYWSDRVYETIGRGGFIIHPYIKGLEDQFDKNELVTYQYSNFSELKQKIDYYLENHEERMQYIDRGFDKVRLNYTYVDRWNYILEMIYGKNEKGYV